MNINGGLIIFILIGVTLIIFSMMDAVLIGFGVGTKLELILGLGFIVLGLLCGHYSYK